MDKIPPGWNVFYPKTNPIEVYNKPDVLSHLHFVQMHFFPKHCYLDGSFIWWWHFWKHYHLGTFCPGGFFPVDILAAGFIREHFRYLYSDLNSPRSLFTRTSSPSTGWSTEAGSPGESRNSLARVHGSKASQIPTLTQEWQEYLRPPRITRPKIPLQKQFSSSPSPPTAALKGAFSKLRMTSIRMVMEKSRLWRH